MMTEEVQTTIMELLISVDEEFGVATYDVTTTSATEYDVPSRAIPALRDVLLSTDGTSFTPLDRITPEREFRYGTSGTTSGYKFEANKIVLVPASTAGNTLRFKYFYTPNRLVEASACGEVLTINTGTKTITLTATKPTTFTTTATYDIINANPGFESRAIDQTVTSASGSTLIFTEALPDGLAVGDFVCLAGESPIPQCPYAVYPLLAQAVALVVHQAMRSPALPRAEASYEKARTRALTLLTPRSKGSSQVVINYNAPGWSSRGSFRG